MSHEKQGEPKLSAHEILEKISHEQIERAIPERARYPHAPIKHIKFQSNPSDPPPQLLNVNRRPKPEN